MWYNKMPSMKKVLFIEDDSDFAEIIRAILEANGLAVVIAKDGEEGLAAVRSERPDIVLLDLILPKMDGYEFLRYLRAMDNVPWVPVIAFTGQAGEEVEDRLKVLGCQGYLVKSSIDTRALVEKLKEFLKD